MPDSNTLTQKLVWRDDMSVGVEEIDDQHKTIFGIINKLIDNSGALVSSEIIDEVLYELREYAKNHFALEEKYMTDFSYAEREAHAKQHWDFSAKIAYFCFDVQDHKMDTPEEIFAYLHDWWYSHILDEDMKYVETFKAHGLS